MEYIYAALLLHKLGKEITEASLKKVIESTGIQVDEAKIKSLIASLKGVDIEKAIIETAVMPQATATAKPEAKKEEKPKEEEAAEGLSALFG